MTFVFNHQGGHIVLGQKIDAELIRAVPQAEDGGSVGRHDKLETPLAVRTRQDETCRAVCVDVPLPASDAAGIAKDKSLSLKEASRSLLGGLVCPIVTPANMIRAKSPTARFRRRFSTSSRSTRPARSAWAVVRMGPPSHQRASVLYEPYARVRRGPARRPSRCTAGISPRVLSQTTSFELGMESPRRRASQVQLGRPDTRLSGVVDPVDLHRCRPRAPHVRRHDVGYLTPGADLRHVALAPRDPVVIGERAAIQCGPDVARCRWAFVLNDQSPPRAPADYLRDETRPSCLPKAPSLPRALKREETLLGPGLVHLGLGLGTGGAEARDRGGRRHQTSTLARR
jgi:hypothetical protein